MQMMEYVKTIVDALEDKKANDIKVIRISEISSMADYLILADGDNRNQIQAMSDNVEESMRKANMELKNREGYANGGWILLDYYDIIVHIFSETERAFYDLDRIWSDGEYVYLGE